MPMTCDVTELPDLTLPAPNWSAPGIWKAPERIEPAPASMLWDVQLAVIGSEQVHGWRGWAFNSRHAVELARTDFYESVQLAGQMHWRWPTRALSCVQVAV